MDFFMVDQWPIARKGAMNTGEFKDTLKRYFV